MAFEIITESTANLTDEIIDKNKIHIIPMSYVIDDTSYTCTSIDNFDDKGYYQMLKEGKKVITSQITPYQFIKVMEPLLKDGKDILYIGLSSGISGTFASAQAARKALTDDYPHQKIILIDSLGASLGEGLLVMKAIDLRKENYTIEEVENAIIDLRDHLYQVFCVDDLMHLRRTGRVNILNALVGNLLHFKPLLKGNSEGKIIAFGKYRGKKNIIKAMKEKFDLLIKSVKRIGISYAGNKEDAEFLLSLLKENHNIEEIILVKHEPATGSHLGYGALALYFEGIDNVRDY